MKLHLRGHSSPQIAWVFNRLAAAKVPLEHLELLLLLVDFDDGITAAICKIQTLNTFCLTFDKIDTSHLFRFCGNLSELIDFHVNSFTIVNWDQDELLNIFQNAKKLQRIHLHNFKMTITAEINERLLQCAKERAGTVPLSFATI